MSLLTIKNLCSGYGVTEVVRSVSMSIETGQIVALLGSNGAGKTTLNNTLSGLVPIRSGALEFKGVEITSLSSIERVEQGLIQVPEGRRIFPNMSIMDNLILGAYRRGKANRQQNIERAFTIFPKLKERQKQLAGTLSGGEQQMLAIARGLMAEPELLILDEPSLGLSPLMVEEMFELIQTLHQQGLTIMLVEQNVGQSLDIAQFAYVLENGAIRFSGTPELLMASDELRQSYLGV